MTDREEPGRKTSLRDELHKRRAANEREAVKFRDSEHCALSGRDPDFATFTAWLMLRASGAFLSLSNLALVAARRALGEPNS